MEIDETLRRNHTADCKRVRPTRWTSGYNATYENGVPQGIGNFDRNRLSGDAGNLIDGGTGNDFIAAGTGADYVHGGADKDQIWGMDKDDILFGDGGYYQAVNNSDWRMVA